MGPGFSLQAAFWYQNAMLALFLHGKKSLRYSPSPELSENKFQFFFCTRPEILPFCTLDFVVATIVAMAFLRRICSSRPGDGEQRGQSVAALTARGRGLDCFQPQCMAAWLTCRPDVVCPNRLGGMMQPARAAHGAFPARRKLASGSSRAPCAFPNLRCCPRCWLFSCLGL